MINHKPLLHLRWLMLLPALLTGCIAAVPATEPSQRFDISAQVLREGFDGDASAAAWDTYNLQGAQVNIRDGAYRFAVGLSRYVYGLNRAEQYRNVVVEGESFYTADHEDALYGVLCRVQENGQGYYFLIEPGGNYAIQRLGRNQADALVRWQAGAALRPAGQRNVIRAVCIEDYLALYLNGEFVAETRDTRYQQGYVGVAAALPPDAGDITTTLYFNAVDAWLASLR